MPRKNSTNNNGGERTVTSTDPSLDELESIVREQLLIRISNAVSLLQEIKERDEEIELAMQTELEYRKALETAELNWRVHNDILQEAEYDFLEAFFKFALESENSSSQ